MAIAPKEGSDLISGKLFSSSVGPTKKKQKNFPAPFFKPTFPSGDE